MVILTVVLSLSAMEKIIIDNTFKEMAFRLEQINLAVQTQSVHIADIASVIKYWEKQKRYLQMVVPHIEIRAVETCLYQLKNAVEFEEYFEASEYIEVLQSQIESVPKTFVLCLENIL